MNEEILNAFTENEMDAEIIDKESEQEISFLATASAWKNSVNATLGGVRMLKGPQALKSLNSIEKIHPRMMVATFNGNSNATIISCYSPTNVSEETEHIAFYGELSSLVRSILKHNVLVIGGDMNA